MGVSDMLTSLREDLAKANSKTQVTSLTSNYIDDPKSDHKIVYHVDGIAAGAARGADVYMLDGTDPTPLLLHAVQQW